MPSMLSSCTRALRIDPGWLCCFQDEKAVRKLREPPAAGPPLALRIGYAPGIESAGSRLGPFGVGDDVAIMQLEQLKGLEPLQWRRQIFEQGSSSSSSRSLWPPDNPRVSLAQTNYRAKVVVSDGSGGFEELWCLLQVARDPRQRVMEIVQDAIDEAASAAALAHEFNTQTAMAMAAEDGGRHSADSVVGVRVCVPVGCFVLGGTSAEVAGSGQAVSLAMYPFSQVSKFVFDGREDFAELPQAFFHFSAWRTGGGEVIADIQGNEDEEGHFWLVDPLVIRAPGASVGSLLGALAGRREGGRETEAVPIERLRFDAWHPRCGQLCKGFDPARRGATVRRACGLAVPSCGVGGA